MINQATYMAQIKSAEEAYFDKREELLQELDEMIDAIERLIIDNPDYAEGLMIDVKDRLC